MSGEVKHTQGPWVWVGGQLLATRKDHTECVLVTADPPYDASDDDKALIAAAPKMLATLKLMHACLQGKAGEAFRDMHSSTWWEIEIAIKNAEWRS